MILNVVRDDSKIPPLTHPTIVKSGEPIYLYCQFGFLFRFPFLLRVLRVCLWRLRYWKGSVIVFLCLMLCLLLGIDVISGHTNATELGRLIMPPRSEPSQYWPAAVACSAISHPYVYVCHNEFSGMFYYSFNYWSPGIVRYTCITSFGSFALRPRLYARASSVVRSTPRCSCAARMLSPFLFLLISPQREVSIGPRAEV